MTPHEVLLDVKKFVEKAIKDLRPLGVTGDDLMERPVMVYLYHLPSPETTPMAGEEITPQDFESILPAITVTPLLYEPPANPGDLGRLSVALTVGIYSEDPKNQEGPQSVINILNRMQNAFARNAQISERCILDSIPGWEIFDETQRPIWQGEMTISVMLAIPFGELQADWRGDFITKGV